MRVGTKVLTGALALSAGCALALAAVVPSAVGATTSPPEQRGPTFSLATELVVVHVTVKDARGHYVTGLPASAFEVLDEGRPQPISVFLHEDAPVTLGLVLDSSGSMRGARERVAFAVSAFDEAAQPDDELFGLAFNDGVYAALPEVDPFTNDLQVLHGALSRVVAARGQTSLYDGIAGGLDYLQQGRHARKVLVVVSDGSDNASRTTLAEIVARAHTSNAAVYAVGIEDPAARDSNRRALRRLADLSGGKAYFPRDHRAMSVAMQDIAREIRQAYTLGFVPTGVSHDGRVHGLRVRVHVPGARVHVRARTGYRSALQAPESALPHAPAP